MIFLGLSSATRWHNAGSKNLKVSGVAEEPEIVENCLKMGVISKFKVSLYFAF
jgi:hypothetical protein